MARDKAGRYNASPDTRTEGEESPLQTDNKGRALVNIPVDVGAGAHLATLAGAISGGKIATQETAAGIAARMPTPFLITAATTTAKTANYLDWLKINGDRGTLGNVAVYDGTVAGTLIYNSTPQAQEIILPPCKISSGTLTIVTTAATQISGGYR